MEYLSSTPDEGERFDYDVQGILKDGTVVSIQTVKWIEGDALDFMRQTTRVMPTTGVILRLDHTAVRLDSFIGIRIKRRVMMPLVAKPEWRPS